MKTLEQNDILEGNKLIAEFMGILYGLRKNGIVEQNSKVRIHQYQDFEETEGLHVNHLKFHSSWDWLMPVYRKIKDYLDRIERPSKNHCCYGDSLEVDIHCAVTEIHIEGAHKSIVEFIKWYNSKPL